MKKQITIGVGDAATTAKGLLTSGGALNAVKKLKKSNDCISKILRCFSRNLLQDGGYC